MWQPVYRRTGTGARSCETNATPHTQSLPSPPPSSPSGLRADKARAGTADGLLRLWFQRRSGRATPARRVVVRGACRDVSRREAQGGPASARAQQRLGSSPGGQRLCALRAGVQVPRGLAVRASHGHRDLSRSYVAPALRLLGVVLMARAQPSHSCSCKPHTQPPTKCDESPADVHSALVGHAVHRAARLLATALETILGDLEEACYGADEGECSADAARRAKHAARRGR